MTSSPILKRNPKKQSFAQISSTSLYFHFSGRPGASERPFLRAQTSLGNNSIKLLLPRLYIVIIIAILITVAGVTHRASIYLSPAGSRRAGLSFGDYAVRTYSAAYSSGVGKPDLYVIVARRCVAQLPVVAVSDSGMTVIESHGSRLATAGKMYASLPFQRL